MFSFLRLDFRSLAALRIVLGLVLLFDFFTFLPIAQFYLSDQGFVSRVDFLSEQANPWNWSLLYISGDIIFVYGFLFWHFLSLIFFIAGYKTRLHTFLIWIQIVSLHNRNWVVLNGGDELVRCCLLILIFLPLGKFFSIDAHNSKTKNESLTVNNFFNLALFLQLSIMYIASAIFKDHPIWNKEFSALYYALNLDMFVRPAGIWLRNQDVLIKPMTAFAYYFELLAPSMIFLGLIGRLWNFSRYLIVISFVMFHLFIDTVLNVGTFPYFAIALWLAFLPSHFWNSIKVPNFSNLQDHLGHVVQKVKSCYAYILLKSKKILPLLSHALAIFLIFNLLYWPLKDENFRYNVGQEYYPSFFLKTNRWLATYQDWHLFAPYPKIDNLWMEIIGTLEDGQTVDLYLLKPKTHALTPEEVQKFYSFEKWRKIFLKVEYSNIYQNWLTQYYCKNWSTLAQDKFDKLALKSVTIKAYNQLIQGRGIASPERKEKKIIEWHCQ